MTTGYRAVVRKIFHENVFQHGVRHVLPSSVKCLRKRDPFRYEPFRLSSRPTRICDVTGKKISPKRIRDNVCPGASTEARHPCSDGTCVGVLRLTAARTCSADYVDRRGQPALPPPTAAVGYTRVACVNGAGPFNFGTNKTVYDAARQNTITIRPFRRVYAARVAYRLWIDRPSHVDEK